MHGTSEASSVRERRPAEGPLLSELDFYGSYSWCLRPYPTVGEAVVHLREELDKLATVQNDWRLDEVATNVFLLSCAVLNCIDEYLRGPTLRLPARLARTRIGRGAIRSVEAVSDRPWSHRRLRRWREEWLASIHGFLLQIVQLQSPVPSCFADAGRQIRTLLDLPLPVALQSLRIGTPTPFSRLDLTYKDFLALAGSFARRYPDRQRAILITGLRSSGSYFAPLLRAYLEANGYANLALLTIEPNKGISRREMKTLKGFAQRGYLALIADDPPHTNRTILAALDVAQRAGFGAKNLKFLAPTHSSKRGWFKTLPTESVITLEPEQYYKQTLLQDSKAVEARLSEYFCNENICAVSVLESDRARELNALLQQMPGDERGMRIKKVFEIELETVQGEKERRLVLAKSVGWGWLGYHGFLIGQKLSGYVPPIFGLRDGILYMEWIPRALGEPFDERSALLKTFASYTAARVRQLGLGSGLLAGKDLKRYDDGTRLLEKVLSRAYGRFPTDMLVQSQVAKVLRKQPCPCPTLIDGSMQRNDWVASASGVLKTDFEHHGMGKSSLNVIDPAYDLADIILNFSLSPAEEDELLRRYIVDSGDQSVRNRLFTYKMLAGLSALKAAHEQLLASPRGKEVQREFHQRFMQAWHFLTIEAARHCGARHCSAATNQWNAPIVALDIDGVLDRRLFGFPTTTAAGVDALSLLKTNNFSVALNTARSASEVREYCKAYSLAGGIAEHGGYIWDAVRGRERVLVSAETARQLEELRQRLREVPGVFLDERHHHSIRAFTYREKPLGLVQTLLSAARSSPIGDGAVGPISTQVIHQLMKELRLDNLTFHHTMIDTTIVGKETDKGTGLIALRDWVMTEDTETIAVGDTEHDLSMFRVATKSFAPSNIGCKSQAKLFGCQIARYPFQRGLLEIVEQIVRLRMPKAKNVAANEPNSHREDFFMTILQAADQGRAKNLLKAAFNLSAYKAFIR